MSQATVKLFNDEESEAKKEPVKELSLEEMIDRIAFIKEHYYQEGYKVGREEGRIAREKRLQEKRVAEEKRLQEERIAEEKRVRESALKFLKEPTDPETVARCLDLPLSEVLVLQKTL